MISTFFRTHAMYTKVVTDQPKAEFVHPPIGHGASFDAELAWFKDNKENSQLSESEKLSVITRQCYTCREEKPVAAFPVYMRTSRHCRYCSSLNSRGLDPLGVSCDGSLSMKETPLAAPIKASTMLPTRGASQKLLGLSSNDVVMASGPQFETSAFGEFV